MSERSQLWRLISTNKRIGSCSTNIHYLALFENNHPNNWDEYAVKRWAVKHHTFIMRTMNIVDVFCAEFTLPLMKTLAHNFVKLKGNYVVTHSRDHTIYYICNGDYAKIGPQYSTCGCTNDVESIKDCCNRILN